MTAPNPYTTSEITVFDASSSSNNSYVNILLLGNKWGGPIGSGATIYYSFPFSRSNEYWSQDPINGYGILDAPADFKADYVSLKPLTSSQQNGISLALNAWGNVANLNFVKVDETPTSVGDIRFGFTKDGAMSPETYAYTYTVDPSLYEYSGIWPYTRSGDIWFNQTQPDAAGNNFSTGALGYFVGLHELGHGLGLDHSFAEEDGDVGLPTNIDYFQYTVMSYSDRPGSHFDGLNEYYPTTPMLYDILAIQHLYGANNSYNADDTVYEFSSSQRYYQTIWDGGGNDTIKYASSIGGVINLEAGSFSQLGKAFKVGINNNTIQKDNVAIAFNVVIENAIGGSGSDKIIGNSAENRLEGGAGDDTLDGSIGADTLIGGKGNDTYIVDNINDVTIELANEGTDLVKTNVTYTLSAHVENLTLTGTESIDGTGNDFNNIITGNDYNNTLSGNAGIDTLNGAAGNDILDGGAGVDKLIGGLGDDTYFVDLIQTGANAAALRVALQDTITEVANAGNDTVKLRGNFDHINATTLTLGANLENLDASDTGTTKLNLTGNALANTLTGNGANNILDGGAGVDTLIGGLGDDTYVIDIKASAGSLLIEDTVTELNGTTEGIDTVKLRGTANLTTATTLTLDNDWANVEILDASATGSTKLNLTGNNLGNTLIGNAAANTLIGGDGNDTLDGGKGVDIMTGGDGDDVYIVDNIADKVIENDSEGIDWVKTSVSYTLTNYVEFLELTGTSAINGTGNDLNNFIKGNTNNNILNGGIGGDIMIGDKGNDTYIVDDVNDVVVENLNEGTDQINASISYSLALAANVENLLLTGTDAINGTGNALANTITGNSGNNTLDGGDGVDKLAGGLGNDTYIVDLVRTGTTAANYKVALQDTITEAANAGNDTVKLRGNFDHINATTLTLGANLENLDASDTRSTKLNLTGNALANTLTGNDADNILDGGAGVDTLVGGSGNDTYMLDLKLQGTGAGATVVIEDSVTEFNGTTEGIDTVKLRGTANLTTATTLTLDNDWANVEILDASATGSTKLNLTGNNLGNTLIGNAAANTLIGGDGNDTLDGGKGVDIMTGGDGDDIYIVDNIEDEVIELPDSINNIQAENGDSRDAHLSSDGKFVIFSSTATNLLPNNTDVLGIREVFLKNLETGKIISITNNSQGEQANGDSTALLSKNDNFVLITSSASNLVANDTNNVQDVFIKNLLTGETKLVSTNASGIQANSSSFGMDISTDGRYVLLKSYASNLVPNGWSHEGIYIKDTLTGSVEKLVSGNYNIGSAAFSPDGKYVIFDSHESSLTGDYTPTGTHDQILIKNLETGTIEVVTKDINGNFYNGNSISASFSPDGNSIIFSSAATNIVPVSNGQHGYPVGQVYIKNLLTGQVQLVSTNAEGVQGNDGSGGYGFSPDGVHVLISSYATNLIPGSTNLFTNDIFLKNIITGEIQRITSDSDGNAGDYLINSNSESPSFSADGRYVIFSSISSSLVSNDTNFSFDVFIKDIITGDIQRVSTPQTTQGGIDEVKASVSYTLGDNIENLTLTGAAISGTGNNLYNIITGNASNNILSGDAGNDTLNGGTGNDTINGGADNDTLIGGLGNDILTGGLGADTFVWALVDKGTNGRPAIDKITDFNLAEDKLDLRDLLVGESSTNILNYLDITTSVTAGVTNTEIRISNTGGFTNGNYSVAAENQHITLAGVNLLAGANEADLVANLISQNKLTIDV